VSAEAKAKVAKKARGVIRDQGYKRYEGSYTPEATRWVVILRHTLRFTARQPGVLTMLILAALPTLVFGVLTWLLAKTAQQLGGKGGTLSPDPYVYYLATRWYGISIIAFLTAMFAGGGAVADDARAGAFQFYFARPVDRDQYLIGKLISPLVLVGLVATVPPVLISILCVALAPDASHAVAALALPAKALSLGLLTAAALATPAVAMSSLGKGRGFVQGAYATLYLLPWIGGAIGAKLTRSAWPNLLSLPAHLDAVGRFLYAIPAEADERVLPVWVAAAALAGLVGGSLLLVRRRLDAVEVIGS
jgi:ABC-type transport system involved in multi-copper enzyme maturation permease subunit